MIRMLLSLTAMFGCCMTSFAEPPKPRVTLKGHAGSIMSIAFTKDGKYLASGSSDYTVRIWNLEQAKELHVLPHNEITFVESIDISSDGKKLASVNFDTVLMWDMETGEKFAALGKGGENAPLGVAFSIDGKTLGACGYGWVQCWNVESQKSNFVQINKTGATNPNAFALSPDGKLIATDADAMTISIWSTTTGKKEQSLPGPLGGPGRRAFKFSQDGKTLAIGASGNNPRAPLTIKLWDTEKWKERAELKGHQKSIYSLNFTNDGKRLISVETGGMIYLWDVETGMLLRTLEDFKGNPVAGWTIEPELKLLARGSRQSEVLIYDLAEFFE